MSPVEDVYLENTYHHDQSGSHTAKDSDDKLNKRILVAKHGEEYLLKHKRCAEGCGKRPAEYASDGKPEDALRRL